MTTVFDPYVACDTSTLRCPECGTKLFFVDSEKESVGRCNNGCGTFAKGHWCPHVHEDICGYFPCRDVENSRAECYAALFGEQPDCCYPR